MSDSLATADRPIRLSRNATQGVILGLDTWNFVSIIAVFALGLLVQARFGVVVLLYSLTVLIPLGVACAARYRGISLPKMAVLWASLLVRRAAEATQTRFRPERPLIAGTLNLPGRLANVQIWDGSGVGVVYNPLRKTISITAELETDGSGFQMRETGARNELLRQFERVLAGLTQREGVARISLQERTVPMSIVAARNSYDAVVQERGLDARSPAAENYRQVLAGAEQHAVSHRNFVTLTFRLIPLQAQIRSLGGGKAGILALAQLEMENMTDAFQSAHLRVSRWLSVREWAALSRTAFDPDYLSATQARSDEDAGVSLEAIGPMALDEPKGKNGIVVTDSGVHTTMWIHEWPRSSTMIGFITPVVFARHPQTLEPIAHMFSVVMTPVNTRAALARIRREKRNWQNNQKIKAKRQEEGSAADNADWTALVEQEESIVAGEGEYRYGAYLTVSAPSESILSGAVAGMRNALTRAGMEPQILYCQQAEALMINALPLGEGMN